MVPEPFFTINMEGFMNTHLSPHRMPSPRNAARVEPWEAVGLMSLVLLLSALFSPAGLRVFLSSAGLLGIAGFRLAAAREGWARRGLAWS